MVAAACGTDPEFAGAVYDLRTIAGQALPASLNNAPPGSGCNDRVDDGYIGLQQGDAAIAVVSFTTFQPCGSVETPNLFTIDYSGDPRGPELMFHWPQNGSRASHNDVATISRDTMYYSFQPFNNGTAQQWILVKRP